MCYGIPAVKAWIKLWWLAYKGFSKLVPVPLFDRINFLIQMRLTFSYALFLETDFDPIEWVKLFGAELAI